MANVKVTGAKDIIDTLRHIERQAPAAAAFGAYDGMQDIMVQARADAPVDTTQMRETGYVTPPEVSKGALIRVEAGFGGPSAAYVARQEFEVGLNHSQGKAMFFSGALDAGRGRLLQKIADYVRAALAGKGVKQPAKRVPATPWEKITNEHGG